MNVEYLVYVKIKQISVYVKSRSIKPRKNIEGREEVRRRGVDTHQVVRTMGALCTEQLKPQHTDKYLQQTANSGGRRHFGARHLVGQKAA